MMTRIFTFLIILFVTTSCSMSEEVLISETGAIEYVQKIDIPQMAAVLDAADIDQKIEMNQISNSENSYLDFLRLMGEMGTKKSNSKLEKFELYEKELAAIDFLKFRFDMRDKFAIEVINKAESVDQFNSNAQLVEKTFNEINLKEKARIESKKTAKVSKKEKRKNKNIVDDELFSQNPFSMSTGFDYSFDGIKFIKKIDVKRFLTDYNSEDSSDEDKQILMGMMKQIKYKYKYTFPKKIKSLNLDDAMFTADGKSFVKEFTLYEIINNPEIANFEVVLED